MLSAVRQLFLTVLLAYPAGTHGSLWKATTAVIGSGAIALDPANSTGIVLQPVPFENELVVRTYNYLEALKDKSTCFRVATLRLVGACQAAHDFEAKTGRSPTELLENHIEDYAKWHVVCEFRGGGEAIPKICRPLEKATSKVSPSMLKSCWEAITVNDRAWTSFVSAMGTGKMVCQGSRSQFEKDIAIEVFQNVTKIVGEFATDAKINLEMTFNSFKTVCQELARQLKQDLGGDIDQLRDNLGDVFGNFSQLGALVQKAKSDATNLDEMIGRAHVSVIKNQAEMAATELAFHDRNRDSASALREKLSNGLQMVETLEARMLELETSVAASTRRVNEDFRVVEQLQKDITEGLSNVKSGIEALPQSFTDATIAWVSSFFSRGDILTFLMVVGAIYKVKAYLGGYLTIVLVVPLYCAGFLTWLRQLGSSIGLLPSSLKDNASALTRRAFSGLMQEISRRRGWAATELRDRPNNSQDFGSIGALLYLCSAVGAIAVIAFLARRSYSRSLLRLRKSVPALPRTLTPARSKDHTIWAYNTRHGQVVQHVPIMSQRTPSPEPFSGAGWKSSPSPPYMPPTKHFPDLHSRFARGESAPP